jgi:hypothetical protein
LPSLSFFASTQTQPDRYLLSAKKFFAEIPARPSVEPGGTIQYATMRGDPLIAGEPYAIRIRCSNGYKVTPHWHREDENIVVPRGVFSVGTGAIFDTTQLKDIPTGG